MESEDCLTCRQNGSVDLPRREDIAHDRSWRVAHSFDSVLAGWLVLVPRRHVLSIAELTIDEADRLGPWLRRLSVALRAETGCEKTYVMQFSEAAGHHHLHFHVVPRAVDTPPGRRGVGVFGYLSPDGNQLGMSEQERGAIAGRLARSLEMPAPDPAD